MLYYSYRINKYLLTLLEVTGNLPVRSVAICCWGSMISVKTWLERVSNVSIVFSLFGGLPWVMLDLMIFLICFMWTFEVAMEGGRCFMSSTVRLGQVAKWPFLMAWSKVSSTEINRAALYHLASSRLLLAARALSAAGCCWQGGLLELLVRLTCHIRDVDDLLTFSTISTSLTTLRQVAVKVFPIDMRAPDCRWGKRWDMQAAWVKRGFRLRSDIWVAYMMMPLGRMTLGPLLICYLLLHGVFTLM